MDVSRFYSAVLFCATINVPKTSLGLEKIITSITNMAVDIQRQNAARATAFTLAAQNGNLDRVKAILAQPAINVDIQNANGDTALSLAMKHEIVQILLAHDTITLHP